MTYNRTIIIKIELSCNEHENIENTQTVLISNLTKKIKKTVNRRNSSIFTNYNYVNYRLNISTTN